MDSAQQSHSTIILAFQNEVVSDVFALAFEGVLRSRVISCAGAEEASQALRQNPDACVIVEASTPSTALVSLFQRQSALAKRATIFVLGGSSEMIPKEYSKVRAEFMPAIPEMDVLVAKVESALRLETSVQQFCKIPLKSLLIRSATLRCDVYLQLNDEKFVKVLHANDRFDDAEFLRFQQKGVKFLFLTRADFLGLMDDLLAKVAVLNAAPEKVTLDESVTTSMAIFETVHAAFESEGFTPNLQKLTVATVEMAIHTIRKNPKLSELLSRLDANRDSYISWHSTALSFLCCKLATVLGWQSEATFYKLSLASMLHDLTIPADDLAKVQTLEQLKNANLSEADRALVMRHPIESSQLVNGFDEIPGEVGFIVEQHHERQDGTGFPGGVDHRDISLVSALFIIAHDIVDTMFSAPPEKFRMDNFLEQRKSEQVYTKGTFGQVFRSLETKFREV